MSSVGLFFTLSRVLLKFTSNYLYIQLVNPSRQGYKTGATTWLEGGNVFFWTHGGRQVRRTVHQAGFRDNMHFKYS